MMADKKKKEYAKTRSASSNRLSGLFKGMLGRKGRSLCIALVDDDTDQLDEMTKMLKLCAPGCEVLTATDGAEGLLMIRNNHEKIRLCLADMVMPGLSGIELLNRARDDPALEHITFALMTEFSSGQTRKTLSSFQVSDDRGFPVSVLIKPLHSHVVQELVDQISGVGTPLSRQSSDMSSMSTGESDWQRERSRSDGLRVRSTVVPRLRTPESADGTRRSPNNSPGRALSPRTQALASVTPSGSAPRGRRGSLTDTSPEAEMPRSTSQYEISNGAAANQPMPRSMSLLNFRDELPVKPRRVSSKLESPAGSRPHSQNNSPRAGWERERRKGSVESGAMGDRPGNRRWSLRHNAEGVPDDSEGVNDMLFDSIPTYDRSSIPTSKSIDNLNWDEVT